MLDDRRPVAVGFSLGIVELLPREHEDEVVGHLGPDLLGPDWDEAEAVRRLLTDPDRPLSEALLDQRNLAGIGNMYAAELLLRGRAPPADPGRRGARPGRAGPAGPADARPQQGPVAAVHHRRPAAGASDVGLPAATGCRACAAAPPSEVAMRGQPGRGAGVVLVPVAASRR